MTSLCIRLRTRAFCGSDNALDYELHLYPLLFSTTIPIQKYTCTQTIFVLKNLRERWRAKLLYVCYVWNEPNAKERNLGNVEDKVKVDGAIISLVLTLIIIVVFSLNLLHLVLFFIVNIQNRTDSKVVVPCLYILFLTTEKLTTKQLSG